MDETPHRFDRKLPCLKGTIFIITYGRSGSTLLQSVLQTIPNAYIIGENDNLIMMLWQAFRRANGAKNAWGMQSKDKPNHPWYGTHDYRPVIFASRLIDAFVDEIIRPPATASWIGFKEIRYDEFGDDLPHVLNFMARHFKNSHFIFNSRDPDSVSRSAWWKQQDPDEVKTMVKTQDARFAQYAAAHPENTFNISYENLTTDPASLKPLFDLLGETFDENVIRDILKVKLKH